MESLRLQRFPTKFDDEFSVHGGLLWAMSTRELSTVDHMHMSLFQIADHPYYFPLIGKPWPGSGTQNKNKKKKDRQTWPTC